MGDEVIVNIPESSETVVEKSTTEEAVEVIKVAKEIAEEIAAPSELKQEIAVVMIEIQGLRELIMEFRNENSMVHSELNSRLQAIQDELNEIQKEEEEEEEEVHVENPPVVIAPESEVKIENESPTLREKKKRGGWI